MNNLTEYEFEQIKNQTNLLNNLIKCYELQSNLVNSGGQRIYVDLPLSEAIRANILQLYAFGEHK